MNYQYQHIDEEGFITPYFYSTLEELLVAHPNANEYFEVSSDNIYIMRFIN